MKNVQIKKRSKELSKMSGKKLLSRKETKKKTKKGVTLFEKLSFYLRWNLSSIPLGAKIGIETYTETRAGVRLVGRCYPSGRITLWAKEISFEEVIEIINHEILHAVLQSAINWKTSEGLDRIHKWKGRGMLFPIEET